MRRDKHFHQDVQPWWTRPDPARRPLDDPWKLVLPPGASEKRVVQNHVTEVLATLATVDTRLRMLDTHDKVSFFDRKPDICICPAPHASTLPPAWYIVAIGEVKGRRGNQERFDDDEIGRIVLFLQDLLRARPDRTMATGFLTDTYIIQFFRLRTTRTDLRVDSEVDATRVYFLKRPPEGTDPCGGDWLQSLLMEDPFVLGCPSTELSVSGSAVEITLSR